MPVAPQLPFLQVTCPACGWSHISVQRSDVITAPRVCSKCGEDHLGHSVPSSIDVMLALPKELLGWMARGR